MAIDIDMDGGGRRGGGWLGFIAGAAVSKGGLFGGNGGEDCVSNSRFTDSLIAGVNANISQTGDNLANVIVSSANNTQAEGRSNFQNTWSKIDGVDTSVTAGNYAMSAQLAGVNADLSKQLCEMQFNLTSQATANTQALKDQATAIDSKNTERLLDTLQDEVNALRYGNFPITRHVQVQDCVCPTPATQAQNVNNNIDVNTVQTMIGNGIQASLPQIINAVKQGMGK